MFCSDIFPNVYIITKHTFFKLIYLVFLYFYAILSVLFLLRDYAYGGKLTMSENLSKLEYPASLIKRGLAFLIDCVIAVIPVVVISMFILTKIPTESIIMSPAPVLGLTSIYNMPFEVSKQLNIIENEDGTTYEVPRNVSVTATAIRMASWLAIVFYVLYTTFCTYLFNKTIGKRLMHLEVVHCGERKTIIWCILRETLGKIILNTTFIVPIISVVMALCTQNHRTIHDMIGDTVVVEA